MGDDKPNPGNDRSTPSLARGLSATMIAIALIPAIVVGALGVGVLLLLSSRSVEAPLAVADLNDAALALVLVTAAVVAFGGLAAYWSARQTAGRIIRPLRELRVEADRLARSDLPRLVETLHSTDGSGEMPAVDLIDIDADGEVAELATAFNSLRAATVDTVASQAIGRSRDLAGVLVNLGRRNQHLIGRQLQLIDKLEATESDPDMLRHLFTLDQMATRMRRNAESLLVLAGERVDRQLQVPLPVDEILRAAASEVEDYHRVTHAGVEPATVSPRAVSDLTHLLAELIENATGFSESGTPVQLMGRWEDRGGYTISVIDQGSGMSRRQLTEANTRITTSTVGAESPTSYLGLFVVGRLAARHQIDARLVESAASGTIAKVTLPPRIVSEREAVPATPISPRSELLPESKLASAGPPAVESALAPITGPVPRIKVNDPEGAPLPAPAPVRRPPAIPGPAPEPQPVTAEASPPEPEPVAVDLPAADNEDLTVAADATDETAPSDGDDAALPIPPFRTRPSQLQSADGEAGAETDSDTEPEPEMTPEPETELTPVGLALAAVDDPTSSCEHKALAAPDMDFEIDGIDDGEGLEVPLIARPRHPSSLGFRQPAAHLEVVPEPDNGEIVEDRAAQVRDRLAGFSQGVAAALAAADPQVTNDAPDESDDATSSSPDADGNPATADAVATAEAADARFAIAVGGTALPVEDD